MNARPIRESSIRTTWEVLRKPIVIVVFFMQIFVCALIGQNRDFRVHKRGMLHETIFNTGEIGRAYDGGSSGGMPGVPSFEWPGNSSVIVDGVQYNGQYNSMGAGFWLGATSSDTTIRLEAFCGAIGTTAAEPIVGKFTFPIRIYRTENYPVLPNGNLNPQYDPNEAEEIIVSQWTTATGITVTRTSRAWSLPDYDDFIIYEYELENTGNRGTVQLVSPSTLTDVLVGFCYTTTPSMFGYERTFNRWTYDDYRHRDLRARFDRMRWMHYSADRTGKPDPKYYDVWSLGQINGGGLLSPQAVGFFPLYYDTTHLSNRYETNIHVSNFDSANCWDADQHLKQPYYNRVESYQLTLTKLTNVMDNNWTRNNGGYRELNPYGPEWLGRNKFNWRQSREMALGHILVFGPYKMLPHEKIRFSIAQVAGYGPAELAETRAGLRDEGGSCGSDCGEDASRNDLYAFNPIPNWSDTIRYGRSDDPLISVYGSTHLQRYPLPQYVNSKTVTIRNVADRAIEAYTGQPLVDHDTSQFWPERSPATGVYQLPQTFPAPELKIREDTLPRTFLTWSPQVESFSHPRLQAPFSHYEAYKAPHPLGPWVLLDSVAKGDPRYFHDGLYVVEDKDVKVGESFYYSILSVDTLNNKSGRTNITLHQTNIAGTNNLGEIIVVPNPLIVRSGFQGASNADMRIGFYHLPKECTIRIFSYSGQLVSTIDSHPTVEHPNGYYEFSWYQVTRNNQKIAPGIYFFVVDTPKGERSHGKFVVIR